MNCVNALLVTLFIAGTALAAAAVASAFKPRLQKEPSEYDGKIVYFAVFLGDIDNEKCSFAQNVDRVRHLIDVMEGQANRYSIIAFDVNAYATPPVEASDAKRKLSEIRPSQQKLFNQTSVITEFARLAQGKADDLLVHFIPCSYKYSQLDEDTKTFIKELEKFDGRILLVSNTESALTVANAFQQKKQYVLGNDGNISERITLSWKKPSTRRTSTTSLKATSSTSAPAGTSTTSEDAGPKMRCIFAGDMLNFGKDEYAKSEVQREGSFILGIAKTLFDRPLNSAAAIWVYGYTKDSKIFKVTNDTMFNNYEDFENKVKDKMTIVPNVSPGKNSRAVSLPRNFKDEGHNANCIVFLTAVNNVNAFENATLKTSFSKEVAVSLKSVDVSSIVPKGEAVNVSKDYTKDDVDRVVKAILK